MYVTIQRNCDINEAKLTLFMLYKGSVIMIQGKEHDVIFMSKYRKSVLTVYFYGYKVMMPYYTESDT